MLLARPAPGDIKIDGNENPVGPGPRVLEGLLWMFDEAGRYPFNSDPSQSDVSSAVAEHVDGTPEHITLGGGSSEVLRSAVRLFVGPDRPLVTSGLSYGSVITAAERFGYPWRAVPLDAELKLDLGAMAEAARGAGMVYLCNPNNPTATLHPGTAMERCIDRVHATSPETVIVVDEAYHEYVTDPAHRTMIPHAMERRNVVVTRTFSKAYGLAGLRLGYGVGHPETVAPLRQHQLSANANVLVMGAALAALQDPQHVERERERNAEVRQNTVRFFERAGFRVPESQANFLFVDIGRPASAFRAACAERNVLVARDFPPMEKTHCRISLGTIDEMRRACEVFAAVLGVEAPAGALQ
ncbi:MAG: aminotransferase class I/II-fold pyridoxal phosphate-dependent enzyme [Gemmatimonadota bacterium]|nr:aminotransferase class I/II-fold pyridoxal phosphate-dependent enzyme [Gemmatimonadota bacterium]